MITALFWISICSVLIVVPKAIAARVLKRLSSTLAVPFAKTM